MKNIRMVDLSGQYEKIKTEVDTAMRSVIDSSAFIRGPEVNLFQNNLSKYLNVNYTISCGNGTDALQIALMSLNLLPGDEVITSPFTFVSTLEVIKLLGLKPVLVDIDPDTFNIDPEKIEKAITNRTKAIIPVHLFGHCADMETLLALAENFEISIIEDTAQALGSEFIFRNGLKKKAGTIGSIGCTSFFPSKNLGAFGDGGAIFTNNQELAERIHLISNHGMSKKYHYDIIGVNSRLDTIHAAVLNVKLKYLDAYNTARQKAASFYDEAFKNIDPLSLPVKKDYSTHIYHQYTLKISEGKRDSLKAHLERNHIPSMIYYPSPLHLQPAYEDLGYKQGSFPVSEKICNEVLSLPMHTELDEEQLNFIAQKVIEFIK